MVGGHVDDPTTHATSVSQTGRLYRRMARIASAAARSSHVYTCTFIKSTCAAMRPT